MIGFWCAVAGMLVLAWVLVLPGLWRRPAALAGSTGSAGATGAPVDAARAANLAVLREQRAQLDAELAAGALDAVQHARAVADIERRVVEEEADSTPLAPRAPARGAAIAVAVAMGALAIGLYAALGNRNAVQTASVAPAASAQVTVAQVEAMVDKLADRMAHDPAQANNLQGWTMLGRSSAALQRFAQAKDAFTHALAIAPNDAQLLTDQADVMTMLQGRDMRGEPTRLIERALQLDPMNVKALAMAGSGAYDRGDFAEAIRRWTIARREAQPGSELANGLDQSIAAAQAAAASAPGGSARTDAATAGGAAPDAATRGVMPTNAAPVTTAAALASASAPSGLLSGRVSLAPSLAARIAPDDTVFVYARAADGPRMPLAIVRRKASELPFDFKLDDSMAMSPAMKLSNFTSVEVSARVSKSGNAMPQPGDLQASRGPLPTGSTGIALQIDTVRP